MVYSATESVDNREFCQGQLTVDAAHGQLTIQSTSRSIEPFQCNWSLTAHDDTTRETLAIATISINVTDCSGKECGPGNCTDDGSLYDEAARCLCPEGYEGESCQVQTTPPDEVGLVVGLVVGCLTLLILLILLGWWYWRWRERNKPLSFMDSLERLKSQGLISEGVTGPREIRRRSITMHGEIGQGAFGVVRKAFLEEDVERNVPGFNVAVKMLKDDSPAAIQEFQEEAALMADLHHHNVLSLVGVCTRGIPRLLVTPFCGNGDLKKYLNANGSVLSTKAQLRICNDVARGMTYLAGRKLVHRDVAARNVLVGDDFRCKVSDFGRARQLASKEGESAYYKSMKPRLFPVRWSAVEAYADQHCTEKSDVWSFGVLCYEVFTEAALPYGTMNNSTVQTRVMAGYRLPCSQDCPAEVYQALILPCWTKDPIELPSFAQIVLSLRQSFGNNGNGPQTVSLDPSTWSRGDRGLSDTSGSLPGEVDLDQSKEPRAGVGATNNEYVAMLGRNGSVVSAGRAVDSEEIPMAATTIRHGSRHMHVQSSEA